MAQGFRIADAYVQVRAEDGNLRQDVRNAVDNAARGHKITIAVKADTSRLRTEVRSAITHAAVQDSIKVRLRLDGDHLRSEVRDAISAAGAQDGIGVRLTVDREQLRRQVTDAVFYAGLGQNINIGFNLDTGAALAQIAALRVAMAGLNTTLTVNGGPGGALSSMGGQWQTMGGIALAVLAGITVAAPIAAAAIASTMPLAFAGIGAFALKADADVKAAFGDMKTSVGDSFREAAAPLKPFLIDGINQLSAAVRAMPLADVFRATGPLIEPIVRGITSLGTNALPGIEAALSRSGPMMDAFGTALGDIGKGVGEMFDKITAGNSANLAQIWQSLGDGLREVLNSLGEVMGELAGNDAAVSSVKVAFQLLADAIRLVGSAAEFVAPMVLAVLAGLDGLVRGATLATDSMGFLMETLTLGAFDFSSFDDGASSMDVASAAATAAGIAVVGAKDAVASLAGPTSGAASLTSMFGGEAERTAAKLSAQKAAADALRGAIFALNDVNRSAIDAQGALEASIDAAQAGAGKYAGVLDMRNGRLVQGNAAQREATALLTDLASKTQASTGKLAEQGAAWGKVKAEYDRGRSSLIASAQAMGLSKSQAQQLASQILKMPKRSDVKITTNSKAVSAEVEGVKKKLAGVPPGKSITIKAPTGAAVKELKAAGYNVEKIPGSRNVKITAPTATARAATRALQGAINALFGRTITNTVRTNFVSVGTPHSQFGVPKNLFRARGGPIPGYADGGHVQAFPEGGLVQGPGTRSSDSILGLFRAGPAMVSDTEYVMRAEAVEKYGLGMMDAINTGRLPKFAKGGKISKAEAARRAQAKAEGDARKAATGELTISHFGKIAKFQNTEFANALGKPSDIGSLSSALNKWRGVIQKSTHGATESGLLRYLNQAGDALLTQKRKLDSVNTSLAKAKSTLDDLKGKFDSLKTSVSSSLVSFGNVTKVGKYGTSVNTILTQARSDTARTTAFSGQLEELRKRGLNASMLEDIAGAGVAGGGAATATSLLTASPAQIAELNKLQGQLQSSADKAGTSVATSMYGAGVKAAEGLVKGLQSQQDIIEAGMMRIAKSMESAIKRALGIKSPAKRMEPIGDFAFQGIEQGWVKRMAKKKTLISGQPTPFRTSQMLAAKAPIYATAPTASSAQTGGPTVNLNVMIQPGAWEKSAGDRKRIAQDLVKEMNDALRTYSRERR